ncbi:hypothetical protein M5689_006607 [Euphorbia peplus]|nr:hypothetical protein M5689_006607 [Euphorbia peplus]
MPQTHRTRPVTRSDPRPGPKIQKLGFRGRSGRVRVAPNPWWLLPWQQSQKGLLSLAGGSPLRGAAVAGRCRPRPAVPFGTAAPQLGWGAANSSSPATVGRSSPLGTARPGQWRPATGGRPLWGAAFAWPAPSRGQQSQRDCCPAARGAATSSSPGHCWPAALLASSPKSCWPATPPPATPNPKSKIFFFFFY